MDFPTRFDFKATEPEIYKLWLEAGAFTADNGSRKPPFVIVIPPPNVTGALHMGHALNNTLQDILIRFKRMNGFEALYLPGTDHAGIATQFVVEKEIAKENLTRHSLGREKFLERVWKWKEQYGNRIRDQLQKIACSCDWTRESFTMNPNYSKAVRATFKRLFDDGLIYRGKYIVNWCTRCLTALSDLELEREDRSGNLWYLKYPLKGENSFVIVATTRPESMLGDTAVAVNPNDERYKHLIGKTVVLPLMNREIPIVADEFVDPKFGTGAVKVTPAHDMNDFECAKRNKLPAIVVIAEDGKMTENAGRFKGLDRFECRKTVVKELEAAGLLEKIEPYTVPISMCYRCHSIIEPYYSDQWFVRMKPLAEPAVRAVKDGRVKFHPDRWSKVYFDWMENIRDWCISRQIWWGHQIPVWTCKMCGALSCEETDITACTKCKSTEIERESDVLDTWFSSALWPFATLGWPDETPDMKKFYPTSVLITARDIINLWVARMIAMGLYLCKKEPFSDVIIHPTVLTLEGERHSKSKGIGFDPVEMVEEFGSDPIRFVLAAKCTGIQDMRIDKPPKDDSILVARNFTTKVWNTIRYMTMEGVQLTETMPNPDTVPERWILGRLNDTVISVMKSLDSFEFGEASWTLFHFIRDEFCDWYIELSKRRIDHETVKQTLGYCGSVILKMLHPFCPIITEELYRRTGQKNLLVKAKWPQTVEMKYEHEKQVMDGFMQAVGFVREIRHRFSIPRTTKFKAVVQGSGTLAEEIVAMLKAETALTSISELTVVEPGRPLPRGAATAAGPITLVLNIEGLIDAAKEAARLSGEIERKQMRLDSLNSLLSKNDFVSRADPEIVAHRKKEADNIRAEIAKLRELMKSISG